jgi:hypothetical protein
MNNESMTADELSSLALSPEGVVPKIYEVVGGDYKHALHGEFVGDVQHPHQLHEDPVDVKSAASGEYGEDMKTQKETPVVYELVGSTGWRSELDTGSTMTATSRQSQTVSPQSV